MAIGSKSKGSKPAVRQTRGPGMNLGLKKPQFGKFKKVKDAAPSKKSDKSSSDLPGGGKMSYLPNGGPPFTRKRK